MLDPSVIVAMANVADQKKQAAISGGVGLWQLLQARKMNKNLGERPEFETPQSVVNANILSQKMAANRFLPNQAYAEQSLNTSLAQGADNIYDSAGSSSEALAALTNLYGSRMASQNELASMAANNANNNMGNYINDLRSTAPYELQAFEFNKVLPWEQKTAAIEAMRGAGFENFISGVKGNASTGTSGAGDIAANFMVSKDIEKRTKAIQDDYNAQLAKLQEAANKNAMSPSLTSQTLPFTSLSEGYYNGGISNDAALYYSNAFKTDADLVASAMNPSGRSYSRKYDPYN